MKKCIQTGPLAPGMARPPFTDVKKVFTDGSPLSREGASPPYERRKSVYMPGVCFNDGQSISIGEAQLSSSSSADGQVGVGGLSLIISS